MWCSCDLITLSLVRFFRTGKSGNFLSEIASVSFSHLLVVRWCFLCGGRGGEEGNHFFHQYRFFSTQQSFELNLDSYW